jgi:hypothetical protein
MQKLLDRQNPDLANVNGLQEWCIVHINGSAAPCYRYMREAHPAVYEALMRTTANYRTRRVFMEAEPPPTSVMRVVVQQTKGVAAIRSHAPLHVRHLSVGGLFTELLDPGEGVPTGEGFLAIRSYQDVPATVSKKHREVTLAAATIFSTRVEAEKALDDWEAVKTRSSLGSWRQPSFLEGKAKRNSLLCAAELQSGPSPASSAQAIEPYIASIAIEPAPARKKRRTSLEMSSFRNGALKQRC